MSDESATSPLFRGVAHIGIAVRDSERAAELMRELLDATLVETVISEERGLKLTFLETAGTNVELLEPLNDEGPVAKFLEKKGEGFHHICYDVDDIDAAVASLKKSGMDVLGEPKPGAEGMSVFLHPRGTFGVLVELVEKEE